LASAKQHKLEFNFKVNDIISWECLLVPDRDMEPVDYYKVPKLAKVVNPGHPEFTQSDPF
jgi:hypothetical protein